jgi:hypothetical protein
MIRIQLDEATRSELNTLRRTELPAPARDRIEMVALSDAGWSPPRIAAHLGHHPQTVRDRLRDFLGRGTAALDPKRPGPAPDLDRRSAVTERLRGWLSQERTWTSRQRCLGGLPPHLHAGYSLEGDRSGPLGRAPSWFEPQRSGPARGREILEGQHRR